jgi:hypothetical protein
LRISPLIKGQGYCEQLPARLTILAYARESLSPIERTEGEIFFASFLLTPMCLFLVGDDFAN